MKPTKRYDPRYIRKVKAIKACRLSMEEAKGVLTSAALFGAVAVVGPVIKMMF